MLILSHNIKKTGRNVLRIKMITRRKGFSFGSAKLMFHNINSRDSLIKIIGTFEK